MRVIRIPGFDIEISKVWAIIVLIWTILCSGGSYYLACQQTLHKIEQTSEKVGGIDTRMQERVRVTDGRFENLEKGQTQIQIDIKGIQTSQSTFQSSVTAQLQQVQSTLTALTAALINSKTADGSKSVSHNAVYEVP